jgi:hypothetical protein
MGEGERGGGGAKSYGGQKVWTFTNFSILSGDLLGFIYSLLSLLYLRTCDGD